MNKYKEFFEAKKEEYPFYVTIHNWRAVHRSYPEFKPENIEEAFGLEHCSVSLHWDKRIFMFETGADLFKFRNAIIDRVDSSFGPLA